MTPKASTREYFYRIDREGRLFLGESEITDPGPLRFFMERMRREENGRLVVICQGERNWIEAEDVPYVIQRVDLGLNPDGALEAVTLHFPGGYSEPLDPSTLWADHTQFPYCRVRRGNFSARFGRVAALQLTPFFGFDETKKLYFLTVGGRRWPFSQDPPSLISEEGSWTSR